MRVAHVSARLVSPSRQVVAVGVIALLYALAVQWGRAWELVSVPALLSPAAGIALAAALVSGWRVLPGVLVGAVVAGAGPQETMAAIWLAALGHALGAAIASYLLCRVLAFRGALDHVRDVVGLIVCGAGLGAAFSAAAAVAGQWLAGPLARGTLSATWAWTWAGQATGVLVVTPFVLTVIAGRRPSPRVRPTLVILPFFALLTACSGLVLGWPVSHSLAPYLLGYALLPFPLWAAHRLGSAGAAAVILTVAAVASARIAAGPTLHAGPLELWVFVATFAVTSLLMSAAVVGGRTAGPGRVADSPAAANLQAVIDSIPDVTLVVDRDLRVLAANRAARVAEPDRDGGVWTCQELLAGRDAPCRQAAGRCPVREAVATRGTAVTEQACSDAGGHPMVAEITAVPILAPDGEVAQVVVSWRDQTARRTAEEALRESDQRLQSVIDAAGEYVWEVDAEGRYTFLTERVEPLLGRPASELLGRSLFEFLPADEVDRVRAWFSAVAAAGESFRGFEYRTLAPAGQERWQLVSGEPIRGPDGRWMGFRGTALDITEQKRAEAALRESEEKHRLLLENLFEGVWMIDAEACTTYVNPRMAEMLGYTMAEMQGRHLFDFVGPSAIEAGAHNLERRRQGIREEHDFEFRHRDGHPVFTRLSTTPLYDPQGQYAGALASVTDVTQRRQTEDALLRATAVLNGILESASEFAIAAIDTEHRVIHFNPAAERLFGYEASAVLGRTLDEIHARANIPPERLRQALATVHREGKWEAEFALRRPDGHHLSVHAVVTPLHGAGGEATGFTLFARDVTAQRQADNQARLQRDLAVALSSATDLTSTLRLCAQTALQLAGLDAAVVYVLDDAETAFELAFETGLPAEFVAEIGRWEISTPAAQMALSARPTYTRSSDLTASFGVPLPQIGLRTVAVLPICHDGRAIGALAVGSFRLDEVPPAARHALEMIAAQMGTAISHWKVERVQQRLATAVAQAGEAIVITNPDGRIEYANPAFERITGYKLTEVLGRNPRVLQSGQHSAAFYRELWETIGRGETWTGRFINRRKNGALYQEDASVSPVRDAAGRVTNYVAVKRDVTREVALEARLSQTHKLHAVGRMAGGVAHALNNLLTAIMGCAESIAASVPAEHPAGDYTQRIRKSCDRAAELMRQLLAFSRQRVGEPRVLELNSLVRNAVKLLRPLVGSSIHIETRLAARHAQVRGDPTQLQELLSNLALNAQDAMPQGGTLTIETTNVVLKEACDGHPEGVGPGRYVTLAVHDTGCGMDVDTQARAFEPFFTTKPAAAGLGLATVYGIVHQHGGRVVVHSVPQRGTTFRVYLPQADVDDPVRLPERPAARTPRSHSILVVEDEPEVREIVRDFLAAEGHAVECAPNAEEALELCENQDRRVDLLITDLLMPGLDGRELAAQLCQRGVTDKVLYISGYADGLPPDGGERAAHSAFLAKPFTGRTLARKVRELLEAGRRAEAPARVEVTKPER